MQQRGHVSNGNAAVMMMIWNVSAGRVKSVEDQGRLPATLSTQRKEPVSSCRDNGCKRLSESDD
jgi:hypothetical protein